MTQAENPQTVPTIDELVAEYDNYYRSKPTRWDNSDKNAYAARAIAFYLQATRSPAPQTWLDVGCGSGHSLVFFDRYWRSCKFFGIDLSSEAIALAQRQLPQAQFQATTLDSAKFDVPFQVITVLGVLEHFPQPLDGLRRLGSLLAPAGILYVEVPHSISYPTSIKTEGFHRLNSGSQQWEWHLYRSSWEELIRDAGLQIGFAFNGPKPWTEFVWILTHSTEKLPRFWVLRLRWFEFSSRVTASSALNNGRTWIMLRVRRWIGNERVEAVKKMLGQ